MSEQNQTPQPSWGSASESRAQLDALWPRDASGQREQAVFLANVPDFNNEADLAINMLIAYGIPAFKSYNNEGGLGKLIIGTSAYGAMLYVPQSMLEDAKELLKTPADLEPDGAQAPQEQ